MGKSEAREGAGLSLCGQRAKCDSSVAGVIYIDNFNSNLSISMILTGPKLESCASRLHRQLLLKPTDLNQNDNSARSSTKLSISLRTTTLDQSYRSKSFRRLLIQSRQSRSDRQLRGPTVRVVDVNEIDNSDQKSSFPMRSTPSAPARRPPTARRSDDN